MAKSAYLILENGEIFEGTSFGAACDAVGEIVFNTSMVGYLETLTDPCYFGQMVVQTFPLMGNYGIIPADFESARPALSAYISREWCADPSNFRAEGDLDAFLKEHNIPGLCGIDTRRLTKILREEGTMRAFLTSDKEKAADGAARCKAFSIENAPAAVSDFEPYETVNEGARTVAFWDFGSKESMARALAERDCTVVRFPAATTAEEILSHNPGGVFLSAGPGDPARCAEAVEEVKKLIASGLPIFGIGLGHQLLALAQGAKTEKLHYGHRGSSQPVRDTATGHIYITSQNHGYAVVTDTLPEGAVETFVNANDGSCEGVAYADGRCFGVQFQPETSGGVLDTHFLFDRFITMIDKNKEA